ncbi:Putative colanic biosynthesis UDP-glucose lipid carrier transferase [Anaerococcus prevotii]|uniref:Sugar transferase n=1 Tax=Anaerococcus prevotii (strain ATCC 9321 / DSM 20548 / JCM 6508 / NCTC 11806 / PC1) TaxID=525919 RepID=C7REA1_ANAPD|nr:sugar transferase [Anaerococcus prevotii]ACV29514.1 sugar transferase [Anaerococcus prevotii DSM 20548]MDU3136684.1 sugar transferase [Anaerococcus prevotii]SUU95188.1 Putative colanic biosynthesis UDP-glucose lipid carrier transferase [Anaerococcus prevotii]
MYENYVKNILDRILALLGLIILSPIFLLTALAIKIEEPRGKVFFIQDRSGKEGKAFSCIKFRSMSTEAPNNAATWELDNADSYITKVGRFIRKTSIDELPQLINIIRGDMSIVGPRPVILKEEELINLRRKFGALSVRPGITGLSQISGRDNLPPKKKAETDGEYAANVTFLNDLKIILKTIPQVLSGEGVSEGKKEDFR